MGEVSLYGSKATWPLCGGWRIRSGRSGKDLVKSDGRIVAMKGLRRHEIVLPGKTFLEQFPLKVLTNPSR